MKTNDLNLTTGVTLNYEGAPTFQRSLREQVLQTLMVGVFGDTFYATKRKLDAEALNLLVAVRGVDPGFLARAVVYARNRGFIKDANTCGLAVLSGGRGKTRADFEAAFNLAIGLPDDLRKFAELVKSGTIPGKSGLGGYAAKAVAAWLGNNLSEYHALKYGSAASKGMSLKDLICMTHPHSHDAATAERLAWLVKGKNGLGKNPDLNPQICAFESLKLATTENEQLTLIREGRLPFEVVVPTVGKMTPALWSELLHQAPYMNLIRNLVTFTRHGVFEKDEHVQYAVSKITNQGAVEHSKQFPFRFLNAWKRYVSGKVSTRANSGAAENRFTPDNRIADALRTALNLSFANMPLIRGTVAIAPDVSASMNTTVGSAYGSNSADSSFIDRDIEKDVVTYRDIAGIFTGAVLRRIEGRAIPLPFGTSVFEGHTLSGNDDILVTAEKVGRINAGGTAVGAPVQYLLDRKIKVDVLIGITDNESWAEGEDYEVRSTFVSLWRQYRAQVNPEAKAFVVTIAPYKHAVAPKDEPGVHFIYGWSDEVIKYIPNILAGCENQLREVSRMELVAAGKNGNSGSTEHAQIDEGE